MIASIKFVPHGSILAEVVLNPAESSYFKLVVVSLQQGPQSVTVHPVLVAQSNGRKEELGMIEILVSIILIVLWYTNERQLQYQEGRVQSDC